MKKLHVCLSSLGLLISVGAFAGAPAALSNNLVPTSDDDTASFFIGVTGMLAQPSETGIGLVTDSWQYQNGNTITSKNKHDDPSYKFAGGFDVGYNFAHSANSLEFSYFRLSNDTHAVHNGSGAYSFGSVFFPDAIFSNPGSGFVSDSHLKYTLNQFDLFLGHQYTDVWHNFSFKPSFGLRYANLEHSLTFAAPGNVISKFNGIGPMAGLDGRFPLAQSGFGIVGHVDGALLDGNINSHSYVTLPIPGNPTSVYKFNSPDENRVVPTLSGRIGADYRHQFGGQSSFGIELGYQATEYFNSFDIIQGNLFAGSTSTSFGTPKIQNIDTTSFSYQGPYLTLTYQI